MRVFAVDPGGTTGWCTFEVGFPRSLTYGQADFEQFVRLANVQARLADVTVCEAYTITNQTLQKSRQNDAMYLIGFLKGVCLLAEREFKLSPTSNKKFASDEKLARAGWLSRPLHDRRHENDAKRHLLTELVTTRQMDVPR